MDKQKYEKAGSAGTKGSQFQVHLLAVSLFNAKRMKLPEWKLSTEDKRAGKFDDVSLEWSEGAVLLQAKHKENTKKRITMEQLMATNAKSDDFSVPKYFLSYQEIKARFPKLKTVNVCTNASVNQKALIFLNCQTDCSDSMISCGDETSLFYTLDDGILPQLKLTINTYYSQNLRGIEVDESVITDENLKEFQKHFRIYFDYPSGTRLENIIERLLDGTSWRAKVSVSEMYTKVMDWFQEKDGNCLTELHLRAMVSEIRRDKYWQSLKQYDVSYQSNDLNFSASNRRYHFIAEGACLLQEIRIWQALRSCGKKAFYIHQDDNAQDQKELIETFGLPSYVILIIVQPNESVVMELWDHIEEILDKFKYKHVVLLTASNTFARPQPGIDFDVTKPPTFEDLSKETRDRLLKMKSVLFQGKSTSMEDLFVPGSIRDYRTHLGSEILEKLVGGEQIKVGSEVLGLEEEVERSYIRRNFIKENEERPELNIFEVNDKLILVADSAGTGKTTTLTKLSVLIKESNPHLWVLKIILDGYSKFLKGLLRMRRTTLKIKELLDSQEATKLANQLDSLVFSVNDKVVLMLDGVDEISPNYTELVESLLENCLKAPNIVKVFATTRPHLSQRLEGQFGVRPFALEPFTERNQIDFLRRHWIYNLGPKANTEKCEKYATALVNKMFSWTDSYLRQDMDFAAIPLQVKMLAEIFQENGRTEELVEWEGCQEFLNSEMQTPRLPEKFDLTRLYKLFVEKKKDLFLDKLNPSGNAGADEALIDQFDDNITFHRKLALEVILDDETICDLFVCYKEGARKWIDNTLKMGIMQKVADRLIFVHRTFAEFFVAECLIIELEGHNGNAEFQKFFIDEILLRREFKVICTFFDGLLHDCKDGLPRDIFQDYQCLSYEIDSHNVQYLWLVHYLTNEGFVAILQLLLQCLNFKIIKGKETSLAEWKKKIMSGYSGNRLNIMQLCVQSGGINIKDFKSRTPLHVAAERGHLKMVKFLLEQGATINPILGEKCTPLYEAASRGHLAVVECLVEEGADIMANVRQGGSELYIAISAKQVHVVKYLLKKILEKGGLERGLDAAYVMIPFAAAYLGRIDILKFLIAGGMDVNSRTAQQNKQPLIFGAVLGEQLETVEYLVSRGAAINSRDGKNCTVLHLISEHSSDTSIAKFFIDSGIDIDVVNNYRQTALHVAVSAETSDMAELLIKSGAKVDNAQQVVGHSILQTAAWNNHQTVVELIAERGVNVNVTDKYGMTLMHSLAEAGQLDVIQCLAKFDVNFNAKDRNGYTPLHVALSFSQVGVAKFLTECDMDFNSKDYRGQTPLHFAVLMNVSDVKFGYADKHTLLHTIIVIQLDIIKRLIERGADYNVTNDDGHTVLHTAVVNVVSKGGSYLCGRCLCVIQFLIEQGAGIENTGGDEMVTLAKEIQQYSEESLEDILQLPIFEQLRSTVLQVNDSVTPSSSACVVETETESQLAPNIQLPVKAPRVRKRCK